MTHWIFSTQAADRLCNLRTGRVNLYDAAKEYADQVTVMHWDGKHIDTRGLEDVSPHELIVYGGHPFLEALRAAMPSWSPGIFHHPDLLSSQELIAALGPLSLNQGSQFMRLEDVSARIAAGARLFLRPDRADKSFAGGIFTSNDLEKLPPLPDLPVTVSEPKMILAEYRFVVVETKIITGSQYARGGRLDIRQDVDTQCQELAAEAARIYAPTPAFICDVAETPDGPRVVEYNSFSAAGLYACDAQAIVKAMEKLVSTRKAPQPVLMPAG
ncbi:ATP-grasp domain-containing protein [Epibacterium sp. DP7N7-1]|nr:ATP-grasp domain-containing protein [Epibacterium sp. DP7N7-1]